MPFYINKPRKIEAFQFTNELIASIIFDKVKAPRGVYMGSASYHGGDRVVHHSQWYVITPDGLRTVSPGDYLIVGAAGELRPCKEAEFLHLYDLVTNQQGT